MTEFKVRGADGKLRDIQAGKVMIKAEGKLMGCKAEQDEESGEEVFVCEPAKAK